LQHYYSIYVVSWQQSGMLQCRCCYVIMEVISEYRSSPKAVLRTLVTTSHLAFLFV